MKKIIVFLLLFLLIQSVVAAQYSGCDSLSLFGHHIPFDTVGVRSTQDYVKKSWSHLERYISKRDKKNEITISVNAFDRILFSEDDKIIVAIEFGKRKVNPERYFESKNIWEKYGRLVFDDTDMPFGIVYNDSLASNIVNITVDSIKAPKASYEDLLNPNRYETILSIKPIKAYYSWDHKYIYLYIFGEYRDDIYTHFDCFSFSYMAKLIFTNKGDYIGRIVERGKDLNYFGFHNCVDFIGF